MKITRPLPSLFLLILALAGCASTPSKAPHRSFLPNTFSSGSVDATCGGIERFFKDKVEKFSADLAQAQDAHQTALWNWTVEFSPTTSSAVKKSFAEYQAVRYNKVFWETVMAYEAATVAAVEGCPARSKLKRLRQLAEREYLPSEVTASAEKYSFEQALLLQEKSRPYLFRLPGEKDGLTKQAFRLRLAQTSDRAKRESLYKFFSSSRSMKWTEWGFPELVRLRNEEAKSTGIEDFVQYRMIRLGVNSDTLSEVLRRVRDKLLPRARAILAERASRAGIAKIESWDYQYLKNRPALHDFNRGLADLSRDVSFGVIEDFFLSLGIDPKRFVNRKELFWSKGRDPKNSSFMVKSPMAANVAGIRLAGNFQGALNLGGLQQNGFYPLRDTIRQMAHLAYGFNETPVEPIFYAREGQGYEMVGELFSMLATSKRFAEKWLEKPMPSLTVEEKARISSEWIRQVRENLVLELVETAFFAELEIRFYTITERESADQWSELFKDYYAVEASPFYANWDEEDYLSYPGRHALRLLAFLSFFEWFDNQVKVTGEVALTPTLGHAIRTKLMQPGAFYDFDQLAIGLLGHSIDFSQSLDRVRDLH